MIRYIALSLLVAACQTTPRDDIVSSGRVLYQENCASCHGISGRGDGPLASSLSRRPTDLTAFTDLGEPLSSAQIMEVAHGGNRAGRPGELMPAFDEILDGPLVLFDSGDGIATPTPLPLVQIAEYVRTLGAN
ncbi:cytochrome c [Maribius pontilimi]|uniref:Cytochrome c n=1 Tax=Palleronia pontilimi TaxID=1964209 RepID=A0A934MDB1_9RHOB|nr:cytochrome c [Palleronia pontilimi]MBJ3763335.1 cytochrome c [Palleronia pontilimi]